VSNVLQHTPDYHIHTRFSCDSETALAAACEAAIARGLREIGFADHADFGSEDPPDYFRPVEYLAEIARCRARYDGQLTVRAGVEIGEPQVFVEEARAVLAAGEFDYVIGSAQVSAQSQDYPCSLPGARLDGADHAHLQGGSGWGGDAGLPHRRVPLLDRQPPCRAPHTGAQASRVHRHRA